MGFTAGIGVIIRVGQWRDFLGLPKVEGEHFHQKLMHLVEVLPQLHIPTTGTALMSLLLVLSSTRVRGLKRVPGPLVALVVATTLQSVFHFDGIATIGSAFGGIPQGLPQFSFPRVTLDQVILLAVLPPPAPSLARPPTFAMAPPAPWPAWPPSCLSWPTT